MALFTLGWVGFLAGVVSGQWFVLVVVIPAGVLTASGANVEGFSNTGMFLVGACIAGVMACAGVGIGKALRHVFRPSIDQR